MFVNLVGKSYNVWHTIYNVNKVTSRQIERVSTHLFQFFVFLIIYNDLSLLSGLI